MLVAVGVAVLAGGIGLRMAALHVQTVPSGSMRQTVSPRDLAVAQAVPAGARGGRRHLFTPPSETQSVIQRIASRDGDVITTKGDANHVADPWSVTPHGSTGYWLVLVVLYLGWLTELRSAGIIVAGLCVALLILLQIRKGVGARPRAQTVS